MRKLIWAVIIAVVLYGGYWFIASRAALTGIVAALDGIEADGTGTFGDVSLAGFPSRFDVTVESPSLASPDGQVGWAAPFIQVLALSYRPNHVIIVWPQRQTVRLGPETYDLTSEDMRASAVFGGGTDLLLDHMALVAKGLDLSAVRAKLGTATEVRLATRTLDSPTTQEIGLAVLGFRPEDVSLPPRFADAAARAEIGADVVATLSAPPDRHAAEAGIGVTALDIRRASIDWAGASLTLTGELGVDTFGFPLGRAELTSRNWRDMLALLVALGIVDAASAPGLEGALAQVANATATPADLTIPLTFSDGTIWAGPIPLGPAPRLAPYRQ
jgi:hypothetical protein